MKKILSAFLALLLLLSVVCVVPATAAEGTTTASGWDGTTATKPQGSGTEEDPYRIASAENLNWIRAQMPKAESSLYLPVPGEIDPNDPHKGDDYGKREELGLIYGSFDGMYFLQTADIDLNGKSMASIGYYATSNGWGLNDGNDRRIGAFAGIYDGNGYAIKNGTITWANSGHGLNVNWACGLFGFIYGATIKNVTLDKTLKVQGNGVTGALVGIALVYNQGTGKDDPAANVNVIENCHVNAQTLTITNPGSNTGSARWLASGGLIGMAFNADIKGCTVSSAISAPGNFATLGGIAGLAGANTTIDHCVFTGSITWDCKTVKNTQQAGMGGIVGTIHCADVTAVAAANSGFLKITNCYNSGSFRAIDFAATTSVSWGGILGLTSKVYPVAATTDDPYPCLIENCYNLADVKWEDMGLSSAEDTYRFAAGILANSWHNAKGLGNWSPIYLKNCTSVNLTQYHVSNGGMEYSYNGAKNTDGKWSAEVLDNSVPNIADRNTEKIKEKTAEIDAVIADAQAQVKTMKLKGYQMSLKEGDNTIRLIFGIDDISRFENYAFDIVKEKSSGNHIFNGTTVYESVIGYDKQGNECTYTAEQLGAKYLIPLTLKNVGEGTYTVECYANPLGLEGDSIYGTSFTLTCGADGKITIAVNS